MLRPNDYVERVDGHAHSEKWRQGVSEALQQTPYRAGTNPKVLDYGCGTGRLLPYLEELLEGPLTGVGYDDSAVMIHEAQRNDLSLRHLYSNNWLWIEESPTGPDIKFDLVVFAWSLAHMRDPRYEIRNAARVCHPGALVVILTDNLIHRRLRVIHNLVTGYKHDPTVKHDWTAWTLGLLMLEAGVHPWKLLTSGERVPGLGWLGEKTGLTLTGIGVVP